MFRTSLVAGFVAASSTIAFAAASDSRCTFPGTTSRCPGPKGIAVVEWLAANADHEHRLFLRRIARADAIQILSFGRSVDVLWSPDGRAIAITDHEGSSDSAVWVVKVDDPQHPMDVEQAFQAAFGQPRSLYSNGHRYFKATRWRSPAILEFDVQAYDADPQHEYVGQFLFALEGRVRKR